MRASSLSFFYFSFIYLTLQYLPSWMKIKMEMNKYSGKMVKRTTKKDKKKEKC